MKNTGSNGRPLRGFSFVVLLHIISLTNNMNKGEQNVAGNEEIAREELGSIM